MFSKLKNFFKSKKKINSTKEDDDLNKKLPKESKIHYENIIPNLVDEFIDKNISDKKRSNSFSQKNKNLCLSENKLVHSNSGLLFKFAKKASKNISLERQYFIETKKENTRHLTSKFLRRGTFTENNDNLKIENIENTDITNLPPQNKENNNSFKKIPLKRRRTLDPQKTVKAEHIHFAIAGDVMDIQNTQEKLEEYQEKMRKTQLRYYVFKKITNYKSTLRIYFQKYRSIVQLMEAFDEKNEENKEDDEEIMKKKIKILKNILKNRTFKEHKELNKYLLRFYYNSKYAAGIANLSKILNKNKNNENKSEKENENKVEDKTKIETKVENKSKEIINDNDNKNVNSNNAENVNNAENMNNADNTENNNNNFINVIKEEIKKEEEKKELTPEEIEKAKRKRNKELRDLFYNKIRERQKWLHDHFVKFYYKGLLWAMKTGNIKNNTSSSSESNTENNTPSQVIDNTPGVNNNTNDTNENNLVNKTSSEIDTLNINKEIEKKEEKEQKEEKEKKEESQKNEESQKKEEIKDKKKAFNKIRDRSKGLRKLLSEKNKEKTNILRKYFFKFLSNGILLSLKKTTLKSSKTLTKILNEDMEKDAKTEEEKKEEEENNWIAEEKKRRKLEEEQKQKELIEKRIKKLVKIFNKKDQIVCGKERSCLQKWNLRAKIIAISDLTCGYKKTKKAKGKKKTKKKDKDTKEKNEDEEKEENKE